MINEKTLIDTNLLVYAYDKTSDKHQEAVRTLKDVMINETCAVSIQNLAEFSRLVIEKLPKTIPFKQAAGIVLELSEGVEVIYYNAQTIANAISISENQRLHFFDALLVATMEQEKITVILTENEKDFKKIHWLTVINSLKKSNPLH